jgi:hypothetical protein
MKDADYFVRLLVLNQSSMTNNLYQGFVELLL